MSTTSKSVRLPAALAEAAETRARQLGYPNLTAYLKGLLRYDMVVQGPHTLTQPFASLPLDEQDKIDEKCLDLTKRGVGERGQLLERILERVKDPGKVVVAFKGAA